MQGDTQILQVAALHLVVHAQVALPLAVGAGNGAVHVGAAQIVGGRLQTRHAGCAKIVAVTGQPGPFTGALEFADLRVGDQLRTCAVTVVDDREVALAAQVMVAQAQAMTALAEGEQSAGRAVVDLAVVVEAAGSTAGSLVIVGAVGVAVEVAQVSCQLAITQREIVHRAQVVLAVIVLQLGKVVGGSQVLGQCVVATGVAEAVNPFGTAGNAQVVVVAGDAAAGFANFTDSQLEAVDVAGGNLSLFRSQGFFKHLGVALEVIERGALGWQAFDAAGHKTPFAEPVCGAGGEHEQGVDLQAARLTFDVLQ